MFTSWAVVGPNGEIVSHLTVPPETLQKGQRLSFQITAFQAPNPGAQPFKMKYVSARGSAYFVNRNSVGTHELQGLGDDPKDVCKLLDLMLGRLGVLDCSQSQLTVDFRNFWHKIVLIWRVLRYARLVINTQDVAFDHSAKK